MHLTSRWRAVALLALLSASITACSEQDKKSPTAPSATSTEAAASSTGATAGPAASNPDGSTLKATAPSSLSPSGGSRVDTRTPTLQWTNATGRFQASAFAHQLEFYKGTTLAATVEIAAASGTTSSHPIVADLDYDTVYRWRVRAKLGNDVGPWSALAEFVTPLPPPPPPTTTPGGSSSVGAYGPIRSIGINEAFNLIIRYHDAIGADLGSRSTRDGRVAFFFAAVAIIHYGHPTYNPAGGDRDWCVKDAGGGRPPSDDVIVRCGNRDYWDVISGAGANGYNFSLSYHGALPRDQNVYAPPLSSLPGSSGGVVVGPGLPPLVDGQVSPVNGRTPDPPEGRRLPLPSYAQSMVQQLAATAPDVRTQSCPRGIKYVNNPWQDYIVDGLRKIDSRWGYNAKPNRTAADNNGVPVVAAGDEIVYHWGRGQDQGSTEVYSIDILAGHCGSTPALTWRDFTGEEPVSWTGAGRF